MRHPRVQGHASDRGEISKPASAITTRDGRAADVGSSAGDTVQHIDSGKPCGARRKRVARSVCWNRCGRNRGFEPRSQGGVFRGTLGSRGGCDSGESGSAGRGQWIQDSAGRIAARILADGAAACGGRRSVHRSALSHAGCLHENAAARWPTHRWCGRCRW